MSYLLYGQNGLLLDERVTRLRDELDPGGFSTTVIDVQSSSLQEIAATCQATPFFGGRRVVVLRNPIGSAKQAETDGDDESEGGGRIRWPELHEVLKRVPETTDLIVRHDGSLAQTHYLAKAAKALGWKLESFAIPRGEDLLAWVQQRATAGGVRIVPDAAVALLTLLYPTSWQGARFETDVPDPRLIAVEIAKLTCAAVDGVITAEIVQELVADRSGYTAFKLNDLIFEGRVSEALVELDNMLESGEAAERIVAGMVSEGASLAAMSAVREFGPAAVATASGIGENRIGMLQRKAGAGNREGLRRAAEAIRRVDAGVKTGQRTETSATIVPLVAEVAEVMRPVGGSGPRRGR